MKKYLPILMTLVFAFSCNKDDKYQTSTWIVNKDTFSANEYSIGIGKAQAGFSSIDRANRFDIGFYVPYLPTSGTWPIKKDTKQSPLYVYIDVYYNNKFYTVSTYQDAYIVAGERNDKASYSLAPTWFVNYFDNKDSVLFQGTFNEP